MCGISGFISKTKNLNEATLHAYAKAMQHRGPNDRGVFYKELNEISIGLGHARLAILDLSELGHQPMFLRNWAIVLNGEIYNFKEIRKELQKLDYQFKSNSDTEVVLASFDAWGLACVDHFIGMFAFAITDIYTGELLLCRDRAGVKPIYYFLDAQQFIFGSELKIFFNSPNVNLTVDTYALNEFLQYGFVAEPNTLLKQVKKVKPGTWMRINPANFEIKEEIYWQVSDFYKKEKSNLTYEEALEQTEVLIKSASNYRMVADVPVGMFLSGGFDSTLVTAILQKDATKPLNTFTIGFPDGIDESKDAEKIAKYLKTNHTSYACTFKDAQELIPLLPQYFDEPIGDISAIPTMLVSKLAKQKVTVALSADGGDELFAGYNGYRHTLNRIQQINKLPAKQIIKSGANLAANLTNKSNPRLAKKMAGISQVINLKGEVQVYALKNWVNGLPSQITNAITKTNWEVKNKAISELTDWREAMLVYDFEHSLRDYLLVKVDRATMAFSLEGREPLLDHRLIEFAAQLPLHYKIDAQNQKRILKDLVYKYVPKEIMDRPKVGFDLPIFNWLKTDLKTYLEDTLQQSNIANIPGINAALINHYKGKFLANQLNEQDLIWRLLVYIDWYKTWFK